MATAIKEIEITITLVLSEAEAKLIREFLKDSIDGDNAAELQEDRKTRESIFNAIDTGLKKRK